MKEIRYVIFALLCVLGMTACQDESLITLTNGVDKSRPVKVSLSFSMPHAQEITVTRADNNYSGISPNSGIRIFVFNTDGTYLETQDFSTSELTDGGLNDSKLGRIYTAQDVNLYVGTQKVYAIANISTSGYFENTPELLEELQKAAEEGESEFLKLSYAIAETTVDRQAFPSFTTSYMPLSGFGEVTVSENGGNVDGQVLLKRLVAQVRFYINTKGERKDDEDDKTYNITFTPQTYTFYNLPKKGYVLEGENKVISTDKKDFYDSYTVNISSASETSNQASFNAFVPENLQTMQATCEGNYYLRDAFGEQTGETKEWTYAPQQGMYVVIRGNYEEVDKETGELHRYGDVSYTIHLGDFSDKKYDNYEVKRNTIYTYNVAVKGVDQIVVEATTKDLTDGEMQNGAEGDIIELDVGKQMFHLDAHYEQVYVEYNLSEMVRNLKGQESNPTDDRLKELIAGCFILSFQTPLNAGATTVVRPYEEAEINNKDEKESMSGIDDSWVEFLPQKDSNTISSYPGENDAKLLSAWTVCVEMGNVVYDLYKEKSCFDSTDKDYKIILLQNNNGDWVARFTIFVNEYFYQKDLSGNAVGWKSFVNQKDRVMMIASDMHISADNNSTYSKAMTYISQAAIQTFYNEDTENAMGLETYNENGVITGPGKPVKEATDWLNGRENTILNISGEKTLTDNIQWKGTDERPYIDWTKVGYTTDNSTSGNVMNDFYNQESAYYACLSRNRDLDGDGYIDDNELRWYLPALSQYLRIGIGSMALSAKARLFQGSKEDMNMGDYDAGRYVGRGTLYYMSNPKFNGYWAVEVGAYGTTVGNGAQVRCVRNLPQKSLVEQAADKDAPVGDDALASSIYEKVHTINEGGNYLFYFGARLATSIFRPTSQPQEGPYEKHDEEDEANHLPKAFVVAKNYIRNKENTEDSLFSDLAIVQSPDTDPCRNYFEKGKEDKGYWRTPNLSELMIIAQAQTVNKEEVKMLKEDPNNYTNTFCATRFSNMNVRKGFTFGGYHIRAFKPTDKVRGYIRCVRDATDKDLEEAGFSISE